MNPLDSEKSSHLLKAFALLNALQKNLPTGNRVQENFVEEFHKALDHIREAGFYVEEFRIQSEAISHSGIYYSDEQRFKPTSRERFVDRALLLTKVDTVLGFFSLVVQEPPPKIAFGKKRGAGEIE